LFHTIAEDYTLREHYRKLTGTLAEDSESTTISGDIVQMGNNNAINGGSSSCSC